MFEKAVSGSALIKKNGTGQRGWREINKEVGNRDMIPNSLRGKRYHVVYLKNPEYVMLMMKTYGTLDDLEGSDTNQRYKGRAGMWWTNYLMIMRSLVKKFITATKLTATEIVVIILFIWRRPEILLDWMLPCLLLGTYIGQWKLTAGVPGWWGIRQASAGFLAWVGMGDGR